MGNRRARRRRNYWRREGGRKRKKFAQVQVSPPPRYSQLLTYSKTFHPARLFFVPANVTEYIASRLYHTEEICLAVQTCQKRSSPPKRDFLIRKWFFLSLNLSLSLTPPTNNWVACKMETRTVSQHFLTKFGQKIVLPKAGALQSLVEIY